MYLFGVLWFDGGDSGVNDMRRSRSRRGSVGFCDEGVMHESLSLGGGYSFWIGTFG